MSMNTRAVIAAGENIVKSPYVENYLDRIDEVEGWLSFNTLLISLDILDAQTEKGNICEIGVHHGRYLIALALALRQGETALAIDLFSKQDENVDGSGKGDLSIFLKHVETFVPEPSMVKAIEGNSLRMSADDILQHGGPVRFFSVDGGHTSEAAMHDLFLAQKTITPYGVVSLDDILNPHWTGVITGYVNYRDGGGTLVPFAHIPNKLLLCHRECVEFYKTLLLQRQHESLGKRDVEFFGNAIDVYGVGRYPGMNRAAPPPRARFLDRCRALVFRRFHQRKK